jgi:hypothetical protein
MAAFYLLPPSTHLSEADTFATRLERCIERSHRAKLIEARAEPTD